MIMAAEMTAVVAEEMAAVIEFLLAV